ncbi:unnamed protein product [Citrullus colocynthis]|uniref:Uncharacterized protein n=1 Tax=Citrullus colocynthis TaxID=252529 RepID=A0ABP0Y132_9ROSI
MSYSQLRILLPWQSLKASPRPANDSSGRSFELTDEAETSASAADTMPNIRHPPVQSPEIKSEQPPLAPVQAPENSETMPPSKSHKAGKVQSQPPSNSRAKNRSRTASKPPSPSKAIPQSSVASNKSPSTSGKGSLSQDTSKPSSPAGKASSSQDASSKPSSPAAVAATAPRSWIASKPLFPSSQTSSKNHPNSKPTSQSRIKAHSQPSSPSKSAFPSQGSSMPPRSPSQENSRQQLSEKTSRVQSPSHLSSKPTAQSTSQQPVKSPAAIGIQNHPNSKPSSQSRFKADSQPSSSSRSTFPFQDSSMPPRSPSQENSRQQPSAKTSRVQSPSHLSAKPTAQSTTQQPIESPTAIGDQTTDGIIFHPANQSPKARPTSRESQLQTKSKQSSKPNAKPVESKASKYQPETSEELTSKNTSNPHPNQDYSENPTQSDQTIENGLDSSLESQAESKETQEDLAKKTNALQTKAARSILITSSKSRQSFEPERWDSQQEESMEDLSKAFQKLNIKYSDKENPKSFTTLIGDNKGSSMHLLSGEAKGDSPIHIHRQYKSNPDQSPKSSTDIEGNFNNGAPHDSRTEENPPPLELYINLNVQGINNSIMCNTSFTENDPGIKLKFPREPTKSEDELESHHARKANYSAKPAEKLTFEPRVRRRCLRGMLMESSDSEAENPGKSRRHGCRYSRSSKGKEVETP